MQTTHVSPIRLLVVDDDDGVRDSLARAFRADGYSVDTVGDGLGALERIETGGVDAVILDVQLPGLNGLDTCRLLRARKVDVPILMITARSEIDDRVAGLDAGADDYLVKPFALAELRARIRALTRRLAPSSPASSILQFSDLVLDLGTREASRGGHQFPLTRLEFELLELLMTNPKQVLTRSTIFERVWGYDVDLSSNSLEVYVGYLRRKTERENTMPRLIHTVRGVGYVLREEPNQAPASGPANSPDARLDH